MIFARIPLVYVILHSTKVWTNGVNAPQVQTWLWDSHTAFTEVLDDPHFFGFVNDTAMGCDGTEFWG